MLRMLQRLFFIGWMRILRRPVRQSVMKALLVRLKKRRFAGMQSGKGPSGNGAPAVHFAGAIPAGEVADEQIFPAVPPAGGDSPDTLREYGGFQPFAEGADFIGRPDGAGEGGGIDGFAPIVPAVSLLVEGEQLVAIEGAVVVAGIAPLVDKRDLAAARTEKL